MLDTGASFALSHGLVLRAAPSWAAFAVMAVRAITAMMLSTLFMTTSFFR
jgi:hypothetical protein